MKFKYFFLILLLIHAVGIAVYFFYVNQTLNDTTGLYWALVGLCTLLAILDIRTGKIGLIITGSVGMVLYVLFGVVAILAMLLTLMGSTAETLRDIGLFFLWALWLTGLLAVNVIYSFTGLRTVSTD